MDGCWQPWLVGCIVDWSAWGALATFAASAAALAFGVRDIVIRKRREKVLAGVLASSLQVRLGAVIKEAEIVHSHVWEWAQGFDPRPEAIQREAERMGEIITLISRDEGIALVECAPDLAGKLIAGMEGCNSVSRMLNHATKQMVAPEFSSDRNSLAKTLDAVFQHSIGSLKEAFEIVRSTASHQLVKLRPLK